MNFLSSSHVNNECPKSEYYKARGNPDALSGQNVWVTNGLPQNSVILINKLIFYQKSFVLSIHSVWKETLLRCFEPFFSEKELLLRKQSRFGLYVSCNKEHNKNHIPKTIFVRTLIGEK